MATHQISLMWASFTTDTSGNVFPEDYFVKATNDKFDHNVLVFNDTATKLICYGAALIPQNYVGTASIKPVWTSTATTNNVVWEFAYRGIGGDDAESLDQTTYQETVTVTDTAPTAANNRLVASANLTSANLAAGDTLEFYIARDGSSGSDTMAAAAMLHDLIFQYNDA